MHLQNIPTFLEYWTFCFAILQFLEYCTVSEYWTFYQSVFEYGYIQFLNMGTFIQYGTFTKVSPFSYDNIQNTGYYPNRSSKDDTYTYLY